MNERDFLIFTALPPCTDNLDLLEKAADLAEPLLDLRYGDETYQKQILTKAIETGLPGLTIVVDSRSRPLLDLVLEKLPADSRIILTALERYDRDTAALLKEFITRGIVAGVEVDSKKDAGNARDAGADFIVCSGYEACGPVSEKTSLVLIQELLEVPDIPLVVRGSLGPQGAAAAFAAGCTGCILDSQLLLINESPLNESLKKKLHTCTPSGLAVVGALVNRAFRFLCIGSREVYRPLSDKENELYQQEAPTEEKVHEFEAALEPFMSQGFSDGALILPVGQGLGFSRHFADEDLGIREVLMRYQTALRDSVAAIKKDFPFTVRSDIARFHGVTYPIVQGPMAGISEDHRLAVEVSKAGALPFIAAGGASAKDIRRVLKETRSTLDGRPFGIGIIGFSPDQKRIRSQLEAVLEVPPDFIILAGGDPVLVRRFEDAGISVYLHAPSPAHVEEFLDKDVKGIILEGHEAGGHVGALGSMVLWELGVHAVAAHHADGKVMIRLLFAGGIANARGALISAVLAAPVLGLNVSPGLQLGTAYLMTDEAVESGAVALKYSRMLLSGERTTIMGRTVNLPSQWLATSGARHMIQSELRMEKEGLPLPERKKMVKHLSRDHFAAAVIDPEEPPVGTTPRKAYMTGQIISLQNESRRMVDLHEELTDAAQRLAETCPLPVASSAMAEDAVAIIGMGCVFPGATNPGEYWENIINRVSAFKDVPMDRWDPDIYCDPDRSVPDKTYSKIGAFVEGFKKDPVKFRIPPISEPSIDRVQFLSLEVAYQALEDAGYLEKDFPRKRTGAFVGNASGGELRTDYSLRANWGRVPRALESTKAFQGLPADTQKAIIDEAEKAYKQEIPRFTEDTCGGVFSSLVAGRICNCFDLGGSGVVVDCACASSLAAVERGIAALRDGTLDLVLAGGVDDRVDPATFVFFSSLGALSAKGSFPFDERADGFILGEGAGMVLLKRLEDARRDGDKIYAVIRGIGTSSDGRVKSITAPDAEGQVLALERTYEKLPFTPDTLSLIEAHGTGTWVGDITELTSLTEFFRKHSDKNKFIGVGSIKSMIGHLKAASGIAGLIKVALALHNRVLPPTINCEQPRKEVDWENSPFYLLTDSRPWEKTSSPRRAGVDSFGFGGINYHAVLEEAPADAVGTPAAEGPGYRSFPAEILVYRASTRKDLLGAVENTRKELSQSSNIDLRKISFDLRDDTARPGPTLAVVAADADELMANLIKAREILGDDSRKEFASTRGIYFGETPMKPDEKVAFLYPGQGSQYINMGSDLAYYFPFVGDIFREVDSISLQYVENSILPLLHTEEGLSREEETQLARALMRPENNHPAMLAIGMGIHEVLERAGVRLDMAAGHSLGEYLALKAAGVFDLETAGIVATVRGKEITERCLMNGAMASVGAPADVLEEKLKAFSGVAVVANKNCPAQTVISGDVEAIETIITHLEKEGTQCFRLPVSTGFHSALLSPCAVPFRKFLDSFKFNPPRIPVQSNLTGQAYSGGEDFTSRLRDTLTQHMTQPVEFISNILSMYREGARLFIEVGPGKTLSSFVDNTLADKPHWTVSTNLPGRSGTMQLLHALAFCAVRGLPVDLGQIMPSKRKRHTLRKTTRQAASTPQRIQSIEKTEGEEIPTLLREALADRNAGDVKAYLIRRKNFIRDMLRLDFQHFTEANGGKTGEDAPVDDDLTKRVVDMISRKTGYPPDDIDIDLEVEAELGLDSIKQVEIISELARELDIDFGEDPRSQRYKISTPRKLVEIAGSLLEEKPAVRTAEQPRQLTDEKRISEEEWKSDCHRWESEMVEIPLSGIQKLQLIENKNILLLSAEDRPWSPIASSLEKAGAAVTCIHPSGPVEDISGDFDIVLDMWSFAEDDDSSLEECGPWWDHTARRASALLKVGQNTARSIRTDRERHVLWVEITSLGGELGAGTIDTVPAMAGIGLGISRCLASEFPGRLEVLCLDFDAQTPSLEVADRVFDEIARERHHHEIGYAKGKRYEIRWISNGAGEPGQAPQLDDASVVLAVGGARGITASLCRELASRTRAQFAVVGRSPVSMDDSLDGREPVSFDGARRAVREESLAQGKRIVPAEIDLLAWKRVWSSERSWNMNSLRHRAGKVTYHQCDIADAVGIRRLVKEVMQEYGRLDLVIQGGGDLIDKSVEDVSAGEFTGWMKSKALGTACLLGALRDVRVGTFINLSSIAGRWGGMGQASYAAGHEVAAVLVSGTRKKRKGRWINIFFGPWLNTGMTRIGPIMERLRAAGSDFIADKSGTEFFNAELESNRDQNVAFFGKKPFGTHHESGKASADPPSEKPFLDDVNIIDAEQAESSRRFDLSRDRFVADHFVNYEYPIMPGVVSLEMITQTASALVGPEFSVTDMEDIEFPHSGRFPRGEPRTFFARASLASREEDGVWLTGEVFSRIVPPGAKEEKETVHAQCRIRFGYREAPRNPALLLVSTGLGDCTVDAKPLWETENCRYRLGLYQNLHSFSSVTRDGVAGEVMADRVREFGERAMLDNPIRLDGLFHLANLSSGIFMASTSSFIGSVGSVRFFSSSDPKEKRFCRTRIRDKSEKGFVFDLEAMDSRGKVAERITGAVKVTGGYRNAENLPEPIWDFMRENPRQTEIKRLLGYEDKLMLAQIPISLVKGALEADEEALLQEQLAGEETAVYRRLAHLKRRTEWLAGRIAAKSAVGMLLGSGAPPPSGILIEKSSDNSPNVVLKGVDSHEFQPCISISHSKDMAVAVASRIPGVGIDVEWIDDSIGKVSGQFAGDEEVRIVREGSGMDKTEALSRIWTAKEAAIKAVHPHACTMKDLLVRHAEATGEYVVIELGHPSLAGTESVTLTSGDYVYAVSRHLIGPHPGYPGNHDL